MVNDEVLRIAHIRRTFFCCSSLMILCILVIFSSSKTLISRHELTINDISLEFLRYVKSLFLGLVAQGFPASCWPNMLEA